MNENTKLAEAYFHSDPYFKDCYVRYYEGKRLPFNIGAFFFGLFYLLYRKLYLPALYLFLFALTIALVQYYTIPKTADINRFIEMLMWVLPASYLGLNFNQMYMREADRQIALARSSTSSDEYASQMLTKRGGVSYLPVGLAIFFILLSLLQEL